MDLIETIKKQYNEKRTRLDEEEKEILRKAKILSKYKDSPPKNEEELKELFSILCFKNIGYCCGLEKPCVWRDSVLSILKIPREGYRREKEDFGYTLAKLYHGFPL